MSYITMAGGEEEEKKGIELLVGIPPQIIQLRKNPVLALEDILHIK